MSKDVEQDITEYSCKLETVNARCLNAEKREQHGAEALNKIKKMSKKDQEDEARSILKS